MCLGKASWVVWSCRFATRLGGAVLCYCESGSGASLGACDRNQSVWAGRGPVVRLTCLTGNCCSFARMRTIRARRAAPQRSATRVQRRCERCCRMDLSFANCASGSEKWPCENVDVCGNTYFRSCPHSSLRMVSVHGGRCPSGLRREYRV
jgi:hypothetical protein